MTAQMPDLVLLEGDQFELAGVQGGPLFEPASQGIAPSMIHTACWRGYICTYDTADDYLRLSQLELGLESTLNGEKLTDESVVFGAKVGRAEFGGYVLRGLSMPVPFSGGLLLGQDFIESHYVHMGFAPAWKYEQVIELLLTDGKVTAAVDRSAALAELRSKIEAGTASDPDGSREDLPKWIERTFTLDYSRSFGFSE